jgi:hypothetical protein
LTQNEATSNEFVMPGTRVRLRRPEHRPIVPGIDVFALHVLARKTWMAGHRRAEATPFFERLCPAMTEK